MLTLKRKKERRNEDNTWGTRWSPRPDGMFEQQILLPSGTVVLSGLIAAPVLSNSGKEEYLVAVVSKRITDVKK